LAALVVTIAPALTWAVGPTTWEGGISGAGGAEDPSGDTPGKASALIVTGDFNRDGIADIAEAALPAGDRSGTSFLTVLLGQEDGSFKRVTLNPAVGHDPRSMVVGDFNGDGNPDLIVGDGDGSLIELLGDGTGNLVPAGEIAHVSSVASIAMADFNRDGVLDLAISDPRASSVTVLLGRGNGSFLPSWSFPLPMKGVVFRIAAADFNGDGIPDLAITNDEDDAYETMLGNGNGTFTYAPALSNVKDPNSHCPT
jgi:hypothetical protein